MRGYCIAAWPSVEVNVELDVDVKVIVDTDADIFVFIEPKLRMFKLKYGGK